MGLAIYGIVFIFALLVTITVISLIETIALRDKAWSLSSHEEEDVMSVSIGLKMRKRVYLLALLYNGLRFASIIGELGLISRSTSPSRASSASLHADDSWSFGLTIYARLLPVLVVLAIFVYFDYYLAQLCVVLSGRRPRFSIKGVRVVLIGAFLLFTLALGNNYVQLWVWPVCLLGIVHVAVLTNSCMSMHALHAGIAEKLQARHFMKVIWFVSSQTYCLLFAGLYYMCMAVYYCRTQHDFWITSSPAIMLGRMMSGDESLSLAEATPVLTEALYWDMCLCYGLLEALPLLVLVASMSFSGAGLEREGHSSERTGEEASRGRAQGQAAPHMAQIGDKTSEEDGMMLSLPPITLSGAQAKTDPLVNSYASIDIVIDRNRTPTPGIMGSMSFGNGGFGRSLLSRENSRENNSSGSSKAGTELQPLLT
jgi:hypothetical protein